MKDFWKEPEVRRVNKKKVIIISAIAVFAIISAIIITIYIKNLEFREWFDKNIFRKEINQDNLISIEIKEGDNPTVYAFNQYIGILNKNQFKIYSNTGKEEKDLNLEITDPLMDNSNRYLAVGENKGKKLYLSTIIDLYDRHVVAYKISKFNNNYLVIETLNEAINKQKDVHGLIIHSDQGFQYTSSEYKAICEANGINISMSRKGTPIDDAPIESWHALLKKETLYNNNIKSLQEYQKLVEDWILFYNTTRLKSKKPKK